MSTPFGVHNWDDLTNGELEHARTVHISLELDAITALFVCGQLQLALRHPTNDGKGAAIGRNVIAGIIESFHHLELETFARLAALGGESPVSGTVH